MTALLDRRLILVAGKGGVGRSTIAAAIAAACARRGRRTLLFEANASDRFGPFFGKATVGTEIVRLRENLYAINTNPTAALEEYGLMILRFKRVYKMVFENRVTRYFLRAIPGLDDYTILGKAWYHTTETDRGKPRFDTLVFDLPASGHSLSMLKIPWVITDTVPEGPLTRDARTIKALLTDRERTGLVLVTLAEEMPANEASELSSALGEQLGIGVEQVIINQLYPDRFPSGSPVRTIIDLLSDSNGADGDVQAVAEHAQMAMRRRDLNARYLEQIRSTVPGAKTELPMLFTRSFGPTEIEHLSQLLEHALGS